MGRRTALEGVVRQRGASLCSDLLVLYRNFSHKIHHILIANLEKFIGLLNVLIMIQVRSLIKSCYVGAAPILSSLATASVIKILYGVGSLYTYNSCNYWKSIFMARFKNILPERITEELFNTIPFVYDELDDTDNAVSNVVKRVQVKEPSIYSDPKICEFYKQLYSTLSDAKRCIDDILGDGYAGQFGECAFTVITYVAFEGDVVERRVLPTIIQRILGQINALKKGIEECEILITMLSAYAVTNLNPSCAQMKRYNAGLRSVFSLPEIAFQVMLRSGPRGFKDLNKLTLVDMDSVMNTVNISGLKCLEDFENYNDCTLTKDLETIRECILDSILS